MLLTVTCTGVDRGGGGRMVGVPWVEEGNGEEREFLELSPYCHTPYGLECSGNLAKEPGDAISTVFNSIYKKLFISALIFTC